MYVMASLLPSLGWGLVVEAGVVLGGTLDVSSVRLAAECPVINKEKSSLYGALSVGAQ